MAEQTPAEQKEPTPAEQWRDAKQLSEMLPLLERNKDNDRKARLLIFASARRNWEYFNGEQQRSIVLAEAFFEKRITRKDFLEDKKNLSGATINGNDYGDFIARIAVNNQVKHSRQLYGESLNHGTTWSNDVLNLNASNRTKERYGFSNYGTKEAREFFNEARLEEMSTQAEFARDIFGDNPFSEIPPTIDSGWLAWHDGALKHLADEAHDNLDEHYQIDASKLAIIADALEEAGCQDAEILNHLRHPTRRHVRGCWVVELIRGGE